MKTKHCVVPYGPPQNYPHFNDLSMIRTGTTKIDDLNSCYALNSSIHISMTVQLAEFIKPELLSAEDRNRSIRSRAGFLAVETCNELIVRPETVPANIRPLWWGLAALRLDNVIKLDEYLFGLGYLVGSCATEDLRLLRDNGGSVHIDTAAWVMGDKRGYLGLNLTGQQLVDWMTARCRAFENGYVSGGSGIKITLNALGRGGYHLILDNIATGYGAERWGSLHYNNHKYESTYEAVLAQWALVSNFLQSPPNSVVGLIINPIPYSWTDRQEWVRYLSAHAALFVAMTFMAKFKNVPLYWHADRPLSGASGTEYWVPTDFPEANNILEGNWARVRMPLKSNEFIVLEKKYWWQKKLTVSFVGNQMVVK